MRNSAWNKALLYMEVIVTPQAKRLIKKLPKFVQIAVVERLKRLSGGDLGGAVKLAGYKDAFRIRTGRYRIVYRVLGKKIYIVLVGHRKEIYLLAKKLFS